MGYLLRRAVITLSLAALGLVAALMLFEANHSGGPFPTWTEVSALLFGTGPEKMSKLQQMRARTEAEKARRCDGAICMRAPSHKNTYTVLDVLRPGLFESNGPTPLKPRFEKVD